MLLERRLPREFPDAAPALSAALSEASAPRVGPRSQIKKLLLDLVCSDEGLGLPVEKPERVFEAFFTTKPHGTGTGLSISRRIIESHGGHLWASANAERGATFCFTLPST